MEQANFLEKIEEDDQEDNSPPKIKEPSLPSEEPQSVAESVSVIRYLNEKNGLTDQDHTKTKAQRLQVKSAESLFSNRAVSKFQDLIYHPQSLIDSQSINSNTDSLLLGSFKIPSLQQVNNESQVPSSLLEQLNLVSSYAKRKHPELGKQQASSKPQQNRGDKEQQPSAIISKYRSRKRQLQQQAQLQLQRSRIQERRKKRQEFRSKAANLQSEKFSRSKENQRYKSNQEDFQKSVSVLSKQVQFLDRASMSFGVKNSPRQESRVYQPTRSFGPDKYKFSFYRSVAFNQFAQIKQPVLPFKSAQFKLTPDRAQRYTHRTPLSGQPMHSHPQASPRRALQSPEPMLSSQRCLIRQMTLPLFEDLTTDKSVNQFNLQSKRVSNLYPSSRVNFKIPKPRLNTRAAPFFPEFASQLCERPLTRISNANPLYEDMDFISALDCQPNKYQDFFYTTRQAQRYHHRGQTNADRGRAVVSILQGHLRRVVRAAETVN